MRKQINKLQWLKAKTLLLLTLTLVAFNSCKKDNESSGMHLSNKEQIQNARSWYDKQQKDKATSIFLSTGQEIVLAFIPDWENALIDKVGEKEIISMKVKTNLQKRYDKGSEFNLVIKKDETGYDYKTVVINSENEEELSLKELYKLAYAKEEISKEEFAGKVKIFDENFKNLGVTSYTKNGKLEIAPDKSTSNWTPFNKKLINKKVVFQQNEGVTTSQVVCVEIYIVTRVYDQNGFLIDIYQEYDHVQCTDESFQPELPEGGGSGGGVDYVYNDIRLDWGEPASYAESSSILNTVGDTITKKYTWIFHDALAYKFKSTERGTYVLNGPASYFIAFEHMNYYISGIMLGGNIEITYFDSASTWTSTSATMDIDYRYKLTYTSLGAGGTTFYSDTNNTLHSIRPLD